MVLLRQDQIGLGAQKIPPTKTSAQPYWAITEGWNLYPTAMPRHPSEFHIASITAALSELENAAEQMGRWLIDSQAALPNRILEADYNQAVQDVLYAVRFAYEDGYPPPMILGPLLFGQLGNRDRPTTEAEDKLVYTGIRYARSKVIARLRHLRNRYRGPHRIHKRAR